MFRTVSARRLRAGRAVGAVAIAAASLSLASSASAATSGAFRRLERFRQPAAA